MRWLIKSARIVQPGHPLHEKHRDILIEDGVITSIRAKITEDHAQEVRYSELSVSPGWIDIQADFRDPGDEYKEGLNNGLDAAAAAGFTQVVLMPHTRPVVDSVGQLNYLLRERGRHPVTILPAGALSEGCKGEQLAELYDLHRGGAVAFTDDRHDLRGELLRRALDYTRSFDGLVMTRPYDTDLAGEGLMHEGLTSTRNGLKGIPVMVETTRIQRDLEILRYTGGRLHFQSISAAESVKLIRAAKREGLSVTCAVAAHHLFFTDKDLARYDRNLKVLPPFRTEKDRKALLKGVKDGTIDAICSDHRPEDIEHKKREFAQASYGIGAIEHTFSAALSAGVDEGTLITKLTTGAAGILGVAPPVLEEGLEANLTLYSPEGLDETDTSQLVSKAWNNPYIGRQLPGRIYGVMRGDLSALR